ncbi:hypothetical protein CVT25_013898 [Psilocybe cyanescens]|uniref:Uncharacterized protein n=1 Tax=Psilocybe cyanescens TaxID=93625 RepID=A0A409XZ56_PSICY|nr:hypothetical protein CVT25_013898 [Psilocybe cyanescens]
MVDSVGVDTATLAAFFVEAVLYGLLIVLSAASIAVIFRRSRMLKDPLNKPMIVASVLMLILATVHISADFRRLLDAFVRHSSHTTEGTKAYLRRVSAPTYLLQSTAYGMQTLVGDAFMLYRVYLVWNGNRWIVLPLLVCYIASAAAGLGAVQGFARATPHDSIFNGSLMQWSVSFFVLTLFTNFTCTLLIASRIWWIHRGMKTIVSGESMLPAMVIIIESGSLYSACLIILLATYIGKSYLQYIALAAVTQCIGIAFSMVILRVALGISNESGKARTQRITTLAFGPAADVETTTTDDSEPRFTIGLEPSRGYKAAARKIGE